MNYRFYQTSYKKFFGLARIEISERIGIVLFGSEWIPIQYFRQGDSKRFSDWFEMSRIGSDTDIGMNRNSFDWPGMNSIRYFRQGCQENFSLLLIKIFQINKYFTKLFKSETFFQFSSIIKIWIRPFTVLCQNDFTFNSIY